jgi:hypothetical protein
MNTPNTDRLGLGKLGYLFGKAGWFFREQFVHDIGIDAQVEIVENNNPTGKIIAIQVKSGESYFNEIKNENIVFRPDYKHVDYWLKYSLPVIVVLYNPQDDKMVWIPIHNHTIKKTRKNYKIEIPKENILDENTYSALKNVFKLDYVHNRMTKLILDCSWMKMIKNGATVYAEFEEWKNKSLTRTSIKIYCDGENGYKKLYIPCQYTPGYNVFQAIKKILPWANLEMDIDSYLQSKEEEYENECSYYDKEGDQIYYTQSFEDFYEEPEDIVPIREDSEIDVYSVILGLNELGESFLIIAEYLFSDPHFEFTSFNVNDVFKI